MLSTPTDLLAAGFTLAGFAIFVFACSNIVGAEEIESNYEIALNLSRGFAALNIYSTEESIEWLKNQREFLERSGIKIRLEITNLRGEVLFSIGEASPKNYSRVILFCAWPEQNFPQNSVLTCYVWRE